jgi:uncharacterized protein (TIGR02246 family)
MDGRSEIQEIEVLGDWAYIRNHVTMTITRPGAAPMQRKGYTLSILRKQDGRWRLARHANLVAPA